MDDGEPVDPMPDLIASIDQTLASRAHVARLVWGFFTAFIAQGFTDEQALYLAAAQMCGAPGDPP